jgi:hypothetical protein
MEKEVRHEEATKELLSSFSYEGWKEFGETLWLLSEDGQDAIVYMDLGQVDGERRLSMTLFKGTNRGFEFGQRVTDKEIINYVLVNPINENQICYCADGYPIEDEDRVKGFPERIDMDKTIELFLKQVAERRFTMPVLVEAK